MAELTQDNSQGGAVFPHPSGGAPFDGEGKTYDITRPVNVPQLIEEIYGRLGNRQKYQVVISGISPDPVYSPTNPGTVHVFPSDADMRTVRGIVESHVPDPYFGMNEGEQELAVLKDRLASQDLSNEELNKILRSVVTPS